MKILWSPEAVEAALMRLTRAKQALEGSVGQSADIRTELLDTAEGGEADKALMKALDRFDGIVQRLKRLDDMTGDFNLALQRANESFETAEREVLLLARQLTGEGAENLAANGMTGVGWTLSSRGTMPEMRENDWVLPDWLDREVTMSADE